MQDEAARRAAPAMARCDLLPASEPGLHQFVESSFRFGSCFESTMSALNFGNRNVASTTTNPAHQVVALPLNVGLFQQRVNAASLLTEPASQRDSGGHAFIIYFMRLDRLPLHEPRQVNDQSQPRGVFFELRPASGDQSVLCGASHPPAAVVASKPIEPAASAAFSPSTTNTGLRSAAAVEVASSCYSKACNRYSGRGSRKPLHGQPSSDFRSGRTSLPPPGRSQRSTRPTSFRSASRYNQRDVTRPSSRQ